MCEGSIDIFAGLENRGYNVISSIGRGGCGNCYLVHSLKYNKDFACKIIDSRSLRKNKADFAKKSFGLEIEALKKADHPNIVKIYEYFQESDVDYIIEEYYKGSSLDKVIMKAPISKEALYNIIASLINALGFLHKEGIAHHDIKPGNIFLDEYNRPILGDFGLSRGYEPGEMASHYDASMAYAAPEIIQGKPYNPFAADIWAFGVTVYQLATGRLPFGGTRVEEVRKSIIAGVYDTPATCQKIVTLINRCLNSCPEERATFEELAVMFPKKVNLWMRRRTVNTSSMPSVPLLLSSGHSVRISDINIRKNCSCVLPPLKPSFQEANSPTNGSFSPLANHKRIFV